MRTRTCLMASLTILSALATCASAQKPTLKPEDYKQWESLVAPLISDDGHWLAYGIGLVDGDGRLVIKNADSAQSAVIVNGVGAKFSDNSEWIAYIIAPTKAAVDAFKALPPSPTSKPPTAKMGLRSLVNGNERVMDNVNSFGFVKGSGDLWFTRPGPNGLSELVVLNLLSGEPLAMANVRSVFMNKSESLMVFTVDASDTAHALQLLDLKTRVIRSLSWGRDNIKNVAFAEKGTALAFLTMIDDPKKEGETAMVRVIPDPRSPNIGARFVDVAKREALKGQRVTDFGGLAISDDGTLVNFETQLWKDKTKPEGKPEDKPNVDVWNTRDIRTIPEQKVNAEGERRRGQNWIWHLSDDSLQAVGTKDQQVSLLKDFKHALVVDPKPYDIAATNGWNYADVWLVDTITGSKIRIFEKTHWPVVPSRDGGYLAHFERKNWWIYDVKAEKLSNATGMIKASFEDLQDDHTQPEKPPVSFPTWLKNDEGFVITDKFDAYLIRPDAPGATQLTNGKKDHQIYRLVNVDPKNETGISAREKLFFTFMVEDTRATGFYSTDSAGKGRILFTQDAIVSALTKSKNTDRVFFVMQSFTQSPNLFLTNLEFSAAKGESKTNPQQDKYAWGKTQLLHYKSRWGVPLQGILIYPADYKPTQKYPMVTYIYERLSPGLNQYSTPVEWSPYNAQILSQNGYFVFLPDIAYKGRNPGLSAVDCLEPAVAAALALNLGIDPAKIGLIGHSWGGYQTAFVTTVSKVFAVGVAGAPLTELTSMYNTHYWNAGISNQVLLETGQGRLEVPFWEDPKIYIENSAVWQSKKRTTPILIEVGDKDGAVDYHQGIALYNTLRRMGKDCVLLVYANENHGLSVRADQLDYSRRLRHFLDVYLKGAKPETWISEGIPFVKK